MIKKGVSPITSFVEASLYPLRFLRDTTILSYKVLDNKFFKDFESSTIDNSSIRSFGNVFGTALLIGLNDAALNICRLGAFSGLHASGVNLDFIPYLIASNHVIPRAYSEMFNLAVHHPTFSPEIRADFEKYERFKMFRSADYHKMKRDEDRNNPYYPR